jgi:trimeric autotransporter adhesin
MLRKVNSSFRSLWMAGGLVVTVLVEPARASEIWVAPTYQQDFGGLAIGSNTFWPVTPLGAVRLAWAIPNDLQTFQGAKIALIPHNPGGAANLNLYVCAARDGDPVAGTCGGPFVQPFTGVPNELVEIEVGGFIASRVGAAGVNYLAILAYTSPTTSTDHVVGLRFAYAPTAPPGVAMLGANTFSGTQSAPAFVGNGSGLTDVPLPSGAATHGANTFVATQTIDTGHLDLDNSTVTAGNLTKNGTRFLHNFGPANTFLGVNAGNFTLTGSNNTATGDTALSSNTSGYSNAANGWATLASNTTGCCNTASGGSALQFNTTGLANTATGQSALLFNTTGSNNTATGQQALWSNTTGSNNVAVGWAAGVNASTGSNNIYLGANILGVPGESNTMYLGRGQTRTFIAGVRGITTSNPNALPVVIDSAGQLGTAPTNLATLGTNTFTGTQTAPAFVGSGIGLTGVAKLTTNTFTGTQAIDTGNLDLNNSTATTGNITKNGARFLYDFGTQSTFLGLEAGNLTMTGDYNTAVGFRALGSNTTGMHNTAFGWALPINTTGSSNTAIGNGALFFNTGGKSNTAIGFDALVSNTVGAWNVAVGDSALTSNTTGRANVAVGTDALFNSTGNDNVAVGDGAGLHATTGSNNIYLGGVFGMAGESNTIYLGNQGTQTRTFIAGIRGATTGVSNAVPVFIDSNGQLGIVISSRRLKEDIHDMADASRRLLQLRPVAFRYKQAYTDGSKPIQYGLIAEEVGEVFPELAVRNAEGEAETVHYETLNVLLLNELQMQQRDLDRQEAALKRQQRHIEALEQGLDDVRRGLATRATALGDR